jgi:hypothetical protein
VVSPSAKCSESRRGDRTEDVGGIRKVYVAGRAELPSGSRGGKKFWNILVNRPAGRAFEDAAIAALGAAKNNEKVIVEGLGAAIPAVLKGALTEVKSGFEIDNVPQLKVMAAEAQRRGVPLNLIVSPKTRRVSASVRDAVDASGGKILVFDPASGAFSLFKPK